jgi:hypothetical protein
MVLWLAFGAIFVTWNVFQSTGLDFRLVAVGALFPLALDAPFGAQSYAHALAAAVVVFLVALFVTWGRGLRLRRRRALSLSIGWFTGLVLAGSWANNEVFWWPAFGVDRPDAPLLPELPVVVVLEAVGVAAACWVWTRFGLRDSERRRTFWRTGRLAVARREGV